MNEKLAVTLYNIAKEISGENADKTSTDILYIKIKKIYKKFLNEENSKISSIEEVEPCLDLKDYPDEILEFFQMYFRFQEDVENIFSSHGEKLVNRKLFYNSKKIELDKNTILINKVINKVNDKRGGRKKVQQFERNEEEYIVAEWEIKNEVLYDSFTAKMTNKERVEWLYLFIKGAVEVGVKEHSKYFYKKGFIEEFYNAEITLVLYVWGIMQVINIAVLQANELTDRAELLQKIWDKIKVDFIQLQKNKMPKKNNVYEAYLEYLMFYSVRAKWCRNIQIIEQLSNEIKNRRYSMEIEEKYQIKEGRLNIKDFTKTELMKLILETDSPKEKIERFTEKYNKCTEFIKSINERTNRNLSGEDLRTVKAVYREFFIAEGTAGELHAKTIINRYMVEKDFKSKEDYYFVDEKINRGMFREYLLKEEYMLRNEIYSGLYYIALSIFSSLDKSKILLDANRFLGKYITYIRYAI